MLLLYSSHFILQVLCLSSLIICLSLHLFSPHFMFYSLCIPLRHSTLMICSFSGLCSLVQIILLSGICSCSPSLLVLFMSCAQLSNSLSALLTIPVLSGHILSWGRWRPWR